MKLDLYHIYILYYIVFFAGKEKNGQSEICSFHSSQLQDCLDEVSIQLFIRNQLIQN